MRTYRLPNGTTCRKRAEYLKMWTDLGNEYAAEVLNYDGEEWRLGGFDPGFLFHGPGSQSISLPTMVVMKTLQVVENARCNGYC